MKKIFRYAIPFLLASALLCGTLGAAAAAEEEPHTCSVGDKTIEDVVEPTCMTEGSYNEVIRCKICNKIIYSKSVPIKKTTAHTWGPGVVTKPASRTEEGEMTYSCTVAGCTATKTAVLPVNPFLLGDVDGDGKITSGDSRYALRFSVGLGEKDSVIVSDPADESFQAADYDQSGVIEPGDARMILRVSVGLTP